jgi:hypothetical protein
LHAQELCEGAHWVACGTSAQSFFFFSLIFSLSFLFSGCDEPVRAFFTGHMIGGKFPRTVLRRGYGDVGWRGGSTELSYKRLEEYDDARDSEYPDVECACGAAGCAGWV